MDKKVIAIYYDNNPHWIGLLVEVFLFYEGKYIGAVVHSTFNRLMSSSEEYVVEKAVRQYYSEQEYPEVVTSYSFNREKFQQLWIAPHDLVLNLEEEKKIK